MRELERELRVNSEAKELKLHLANLEFIRREAYRGMDLLSTEPARIGELRKEIRAVRVARGLHVWECSRCDV